MGKWDNTLEQPCGVRIVSGGNEWEFSGNSRLPLEQHSNSYTNRLQSPGACAYNPFVQHSDAR